MKRLILIIVSLFCFNQLIQAQINIYPNQSTVSTNSEFLIWDNATVNQTFDNLQNQISDSVFFKIRLINPVTNSISLNTERYYLSHTVSGNTTYNLSNPTKTGIFTLLVYGSANATITFAFSSGDLYAPFGLTNFEVETGKYNLIQFIVVSSTKIIILWQDQLTKIN